VCRYRGHVIRDSAVVILTGPPGAGKSTVAARLARSHPRAVHLHTDDFWHFIVAGAVPPYEPASHPQNETVMDVIAGAAFSYAAGGYFTVADGIIGPWMLPRFAGRSRTHPDVELHYIVLRPRLDVALARARARPGPGALVDEEPIVQMWRQFADLGHLETHVFDTSEHDDAATERAVMAVITSGALRLHL
jgi:hypothetical protein